MINYKLWLNCNKEIDLNLKHQGIILKYSHIILLIKIITEVYESYEIKSRHSYA